MFHYLAEKLKLGVVSTPRIADGSRDCLQARLLTSQLMSVQLKGGYWKILYPPLTQVTSSLVCRRNLVLVPLNIL